MGHPSGRVAQVAGNRLVRGIMLRGAGLIDLWLPLAALIAFVVIALTVAVSRVHKRLD